MSRPGARSECRGPARLLSVGARRSLCRGPALLVSGPRAACVRDRRCRGSASRPGAPLRRLSGKVPAICVSGPGAFCRGLCQGLAVLFRLCLCRGPALFVSGPGAPCVGARRVHSQDFIFQIPAVCVGSGAYCCLSRPCVSGPGALCVGARRLSVGARRSLCRGPALCVGAPTLLLSVGARRFSALCVGARRAVSVSGPGDLRRFVSGPCALSECRSPALFVSGPGAPCAGARRAI